MLSRAVAELGPWSWWLLGLLLLAAELLLPECSWCGSASARSPPGCSPAAVEAR